MKKKKKKTGRIKISVSIPSKVDLLSLLSEGDYWRKEENLSQLLRVIGHIQEKYNRKKIKHARFVPVPATYWSKVLGKSYLSVIEKLISLGVIRKNDRYSAKKGKGFPMSYQIAEAYWSKPRFISISVKPYNPKPKKKPDLSVLNDVVTRYLHKCHSEITIDEELLQGNQGDIASKIFTKGMEQRKRRCLLAAKRLKDGTWNVRRGTVQDRVYHLVITGVRELRPFIRKDGKPLVDVDIRTAQPALLHAFYPDKDCEEAKKFRQVQDQDFYRWMSKEGNREQAKEDFRPFAFGGRKRLKPFAKKFKKAFPILFAEMWKYDGSELCRKLQSMESEVVNNFLVTEFMRRGLFILSQHDGILCEHRNVLLANNLLKGEFYKKTGYAPALKVKDFASEYPFKEEYI